MSGGGKSRRPQVRLRELRRRHRPAAEVTLHFVASLAAQEFQLPGGLHAFGQNPQAKGTA
jgi:hypothetical protein